MNGKLKIGREWMEGESDAFTSVDPSDGSAVWQGNAASTAQIDRAMEAAAAAFPAWAATPLDTRIAVLETYRGIVETRAAEIAEMIARETGKPRWDSLGEAKTLSAKVAISITAYHERTGSRSAPMASFRQELRHAPLGPLAVFGPYNFPAHLPNGHIVPALLAGNTIVLKPSEETPATSELIVRCWEEAGLPAGVLNLVQGARAVGQHLSTHPLLAGLLFTGSAPTGQAIHRALGGRPEVMLALEMGGNNPLIATRFADPDAAVRLIVQSAYASSGQRCTCARRLIVPTGNEGDRLLEALAAMLPRLRVGAWDATPEPFMGPLVGTRQAEGVLRAQAELIAAGAKPIVESKPLHATLPYLSPGLLDITAARYRPDEEIFGPVLQVIRVPDIDAALIEANATRFGLSAGLISDDAALWARFRATVRAGVVNWNRPLTGASSAAPFGGPGLSGNLRPSAYYAADYCAYPVATLADDVTRYDDAIVGVRASGIDP